MTIKHNLVVLGDIAMISSGGTPSRSNPKYWNGNIPWIKTTQIQNCNINESDVDECITEEGLKNSSAKMIPAETILMAMYGQRKTRGQVSILNFDASTNQACAAIELTKGIYRDFVYQFLLARYTHVRNMSNTGGQKNLSSGLIREIPLFLPPLTEQKAIADLLSTWDKAIETIERLTLAKEKQFKQTARWLLFGQKRLNNQQSELTDGRFFKYPCDWGLIKIGKIAKEVSVRNGQSEETVLSCSKYDGFVNSLDYFGKQIFSSDTSNYKVIKKDQFGYPSNHVEEGSIGLLEHCDKGIVSPIYVVFEVMEEEVLPLYLFKLLKTDIYRHIFQVNTSSSVDRRGSLRWRVKPEIVQKYKEATGG